MEIPAIMGTAGGANGLQSYRADVVDGLLDEDGQLIEWMIGFAFDTLGAQHFELRVTAGCAQGAIDAAYPIWRSGQPAHEQPNQAAGQH